MAAAADERRLEPVGCGQHRAGLGRDDADGDAGPAVEAEDVGHPGADAAVEDAGVDQPLAAAAALLGGLEQELHADRQVGQPLLHDGRGREQCGRVAVVAAGVHPAGVGAGVGEAGPLLDRQGVDVGPEGDAREGHVADPGDGRRRRVGHAGDELDPEPGQLGADQLGRLVLGVSELRDAVQPVAQLDRRGECRGHGGVGDGHGLEGNTKAGRRRRAGEPGRRASRR